MSSRKSPAAARRPVWLFAALLTAAAVGSPTPAAADWAQWRGDGRDGSVNVVEPLRRDLPSDGLEPLWMNVEDLGGGGGWSSPIVADGRVYLYAHQRERREDVQLPEPKYPALSDEQKAKKTPAELAEYEKLHDEEERTRREMQFRYTDQIHCLDARTGEAVWTSTRTSEQTRWRQSSTPTVSGDRLYYLGADRDLVCLDTDGGKEIWTAELPIDQEDITPVSSSPLVIGGKVVVLAERLVAVSAADGSVAWSGDSTQEGAVYSSPVGWTANGQHRVIANVSGIGTVCVDANNGEELWRVDSGGGRSSPVVSGQYLVTYAGSRKGGLRCYRLTGTSTAEPPELLWKYQRMADQGSSPAVAAGRVFVQGDRYFAALDLESGDAIWQTRLDRDRPRYTSPIVAGDLVLYTFGGVIGVSVSADSYEPVFDARLNKQGLLAPEEHYREALRIDELERTAEGQQEAQRVWKEEIERHGPRDCVSPAFADGRLYLRTNQGLVCYDLSQAD